jgi:iron complex outermembrane receptor protein
VNGRVNNSQFRERALKGMLGVKERWGHSLLKMRYFHQRPGIIEAPDEDPFQKINHYKVVTDNMFYVGDGVLKAIVGYQHNRRQEYEENQVGLDFMLHTINYDVRYVFPFSWKLNVGTNGMWQQSRNKGVEALIPAYHLIDFGIFSTASESFGPVHVSGGLRFDHRHVNWEPINTTAQQPSPTSTRSFYAVTGSIGAIWNITPNLDLRLNIARGFRAPNMSELGSDGEHEGTFRYEVGNADLKPEYSWQGDLGLDFSSEYFSTRLSLFANRITNYIFAEKTGGVSAEGTSIFRFTQGDARILGGEATVILHPVHHLHWENSFSYVNSVQMHQPEETKYLPFTPAPRWMSTIHYDIKGSCTWIKNLFAEAQMECYLKQNNVYRLNNTETPTPSYTLFNVVTGTDFLIHGKRFASLHLSVNNLFNRAYQNHLSRLKEGGIYNMGRNIAMKVIFTI